MNAAQKTAQNADQVEFSALQNQNASIDEGLIDESISGEFEDSTENFTDDLDAEEYAMRDRYDDTQQGRILEELQNRIKLLGNCYPFELKQLSLRYKTAMPDQVNAYVALLQISLATSRQGSNWHSLVGCFEYLSALVLKEFFQCTNAWWTGAGATDPLRSYIENIHKRTGELEWNPDPNFPNSLSNVKDAGLDFINYRNLVDTRTGGIFYFGQSACGNDWPSKVKNELKRNRYSRFFRSPYANPVKVFTMPYLITSNNEIMLAAMDELSGLVFDRARLTKLIWEMGRNNGVNEHIQKIIALAEKCS